jgi:hypothetical protein
VFSASLQGLWLGFIQFVPNLIFAIIVFIIGWAIGTLVSKAIAQVFGALKVDKLFQSMGVEEYLSRAGYKLNVGHFIGEIVKWFVVLVFLMTSFEILGLTRVTDFLKEVVLGYLPQVIVAALILVAATIISSAVSRLVSGAARASNISSANMLGAIAHYAIWIFAIIIALSELGIAPVFMQTLFSGIIALLAIAGGLAFGLGGKEHASRALDSLTEKMK